MRCCYCGQTGESGDAVLLLRSDRGEWGRCATFAVRPGTVGMLCYSSGQTVESGDAVLLLRPDRGEWGCCATVAFEQEGR